MPCGPDVHTPSNAGAECDAIFRARLLNGPHSTDVASAAGYSDDEYFSVSAVT